MVKRKNNANRELGELFFVCIQLFAASSFSVLFAYSLANSIFKGYRVRTRENFSVKVIKNDLHLLPFLPLPNPLNGSQFRDSSTCLNPQNLPTNKCA